MSSAAETVDVRAVEVTVTEDELTVRLDDGRTLITPLAWYPRLVHASAKERANFRLVGGGIGVHWPDLDEDLSVAAMLAGNPSSEGSESLRKWLQARRSKSASRGEDA